MKILSLLFFISLTSIAFSQNSWTQIYNKGLGTTVEQTADGGYIILGGPDYSDSATVLIKTNAYGDITWLKTYALNNARAKFVKQASDGGYVFCGGAPGFLSKTDIDGAILWTETFSGPSAADILFRACDVADDGYVLTGYIADTSSTLGSGSTDLIVLKTNFLGVEQWRKTYGLPDNGCTLGCAEDEGRAIRVLASNEIVVAGDYGGGGYNSSTWNTWQGWLLKMDQYGDTIWTRKYGGNQLDMFGNIDLTNDGGYILVGTSYDGPGASAIYTVKTDANGTIEWQQYYSDYWMGGTGIKQTSDGGYIILGVTETSPGGAESIILIKTDALGDTTWTRLFGTNSESDEPSNSLLQANDGGYVFTGFTKSYGIVDERNIWLVKTDQNGVVSVNEIDEDAEIILFPNPSNDIITLAIAQHSNGQIILTDILGKEVLSKSFTANEVQLNLNNLAAKGTYFAKIIDVDGNVIAIKKLIYQ
jgi:hypothetical protein